MVFMLAVLYSLFFTLHTVGLANLGKYLTSMEASTVVCTCIRLWFWAVGVGVFRAAAAVPGTVP